VVWVRGVAAVVLTAAAVGSVGASANELDDALAQAWFWSPSPTVPKEAKRSETAKTDEKPDGEPHGPEWFWSFKRSDPQKSRGPKELIAFSGSDVWRQGAFGYGGALWAPGGLDGDGFVVKLFATRGYYAYRSGTLGNATVSGIMYAASVMPGMRFSVNGVFVTVYAGLDYQVHALTPVDPTNETIGSHAGARFAADLWYEPSKFTMTAFSATLSTIGGAYAVRAAFGWRLWESVYVGPEALAYGQRDYRQVRIGAHITGLKFLRLEWQAGVGYALDDDGNAGAYVRLGVSDRW
jgi:hypothetical protein